MPKMEAASYSETSVAVNTAACTSRPEYPLAPLWEFNLVKMYPVRLRFCSRNPCIYIPVIATFSGYKLLSLFTVNKGKSLIVTVASSWNNPYSASNAGESQNKERNSPWRGEWYKVKKIKNDHHCYTRCCRVGLFQLPCSLLLDTAVLIVKEWKLGI